MKQQVVTYLGLLLIGFSLHAMEVVEQGHPSKKRHLEEQQEESKRQRPQGVVLREFEEVKTAAAMWKLFGQVSDENTDFLMQATFHAVLYNPHITLGAKQTLIEAMRQQSSSPLHKDFFDFLNRSYIQSFIGSGRELSDHAVPNMQTIACRGATVVDCAMSDLQNIKQLRQAGVQAGHDTACNNCAQCQFVDRLLDMNLAPGGIEPLLYHGNTHLVGRIFTIKKDSHFYDWAGNTLFHRLFQNTSLDDASRLSMVSYLLGTRIKNDINKENKAEVEPLFWAVKSESAACVQELLNNNADPTVPNGFSDCKTLINFSTKHFRESSQEEQSKRNADIVYALCNTKKVSPSTGDWQLIEKNTFHGQQLITALQQIGVHKSQSVSQPLVSRSGGMNIHRMNQESFLWCSQSGV